MRIARLSALCLAAVAFARVVRADPPVPASPPPAGTAPAPAAATAPTEEDFLAALARARAQLAAGDGSGGQRTIDDALALHGDQDYVRAKRVELEDLVKRLAFRKECPPPDPATMVKGSLKKFVAKTGDFEIRYTAGKPNDFETAGSGTLEFPARFQGPFTVSVKGTSYPGDTPPRIAVGGAEDPRTHKHQTWIVHAGIPARVEGREKRWMPARIVLRDGDEEKVVSEKPTSPAKIGAPWRLKVQVTRSKVFGFLDDTGTGSAPKPDGVFGTLAIVAPGWTEIAIEGQIEPSWIQGRIDAIVEGKRGAFDAKFDAKEHLPAWLYAPPKRVAGAPAAPGSDDPDAEALPAKHRLSVLRVRLLLQTDQAEDALEVVRSLETSGAPEALVLALFARVHLAMGETAKALTEAERATAADPKSLDALLARGDVLVHLGREDEAAALWDAAGSGTPCATDFYLQGAMSMLLAGRIDTAKRLAERAERLGRRSPALDALGRVVAQATGGPTWPRTFEYKTTNYLVQSDIDADVCAKAANLLEDALQVYAQQVKAPRAEKRRAYRVFLFSGKEGFSRYMTDLEVLAKPPMENVAGLYTPLLKQLLIWNLPSRAEMMRTVRHEGFHQYLDRLLPDPPVWFNEGMAVYYEGMERVGGELKIGRIRYDDVALLEKQPLIPLRDFLSMTRAEFYRGNHHSYAQAWLLVHMLKHGNAKHRELYRTLLARLETTGGRDATREVFPAEILPTLDADLAAWRVTLAKPK